MQPMGGSRLLYFVKSKKGTKCKNFAEFLCQYIHSFVFPKMVGRKGGLAVTYVLENTYVIVIYMRMR